MRADVGWDAHKVEIGGPVAEGMGAAEGEDDDLEGVVDGDVAGYAC